LSAIQALYQLSYSPRTGCAGSRAAAPLRASGASEARVQIQPQGDEADSKR
jgi:hypothetical protein